MLYLVINEAGIPEHRWSVDPDLDFAGLKVIGEALKDIDGKYADSALLDVVNGTVVISEVKRKTLEDAAKAAADAVLAKDDRKKKLRKRIKELADKDPLTPDEVSEALKLLLKLIKESDL